MNLSNFAALSVKLRLWHLIQLWHFIQFNQKFLKVVKKNPLKKTVHFLILIFGLFGH